MASQLEQKAGRVLRTLEEHGLKLEDIPPNVVHRRVVFNELSNFYDLQVLRLMRWKPEMFDTSYTDYVSPCELKMYLHAVTLHHLRINGMLATYDGFVPTDCTGFAVPKPMMIWLSLMSRYSEGASMGVPHYNMTAEPAAAAKTISVGSATESNLALGLFVVNAFATNSTYKERVSTTVSGALTYQAVMARAEFIGSQLMASDYPCMRYPDQEFIAPDASFYTTPFIGTATTGDVTDFLFFGNAFSKWSEEFSWLYYSSEVVYDNVVPVARRVAPRTHLFFASSPSGNVCFTTSIGGIPAAWQSSFLVIAENMEWSFGADPVRTLNYSGIPIKSLAVSYTDVDLAPYHEMVARAMSMLIEGQSVDGNTPKISLAQVLSFLIVHDLAAAAKLVRYDPRISVSRDGSEGSIMYATVPNISRSILVSVPAAQALHDLGPVVYDGYLHTPVLPNYFQANAAWYRWSANGFDTTRSALDPSFAGCFGIKQSTPAAVDLNFLDQVVNSAWVTGYAALSGALFFPWSALGQLMDAAREIAATGNVPGRGDLMYPIPFNSRGLGGLSMLTRYFGGDDFGTAIFLTEPDGPTNFTVRHEVVRGLGSSVSLPADELGVTLMCPWAYAHEAQVTTGPYKRVLSELGTPGVNARSLEVLRALTSAEGTFVRALHEAYQHRHLGGSSLGILAPGEELGVCLWDAVKTLAGQLGKVLAPSAGAAASVGCNMILPGSGGLCASGAEAIIDRVATLAKSGTNRHEPTPVRKELDVISSAIVNIVKENLKKNSDLPVPHAPPGSNYAIQTEYGIKAGAKVKHKKAKISNAGVMPASPGGHGTVAKGAPKPAAKPSPGKAVAKAQPAKKVMAVKPTPSKANARNNKKK